MSEIAIASPSLPQSLVLFGDIEAHNDFLIENGFDGGLELHPMRRITRLSRNLAELAQTGSDQSATERFIAGNVVRSAHQSFISRAEGMLPHGRLKEDWLTFKGLMVFYGAEASLGVISDIQRGFSASGLPVVVYPEVGRKDGYSALPFSDTLFQPNIRIMNKWGIRTTEELLQKAKSEGLSGIAWDGYHYQRSDENGQSMEDWHKVLPMLLEGSELPIRETHISLGRAEKAERQDLVESSMQELDVFINHPEKIEATTTGQMIKQIHEATKGKMRFVIESQLSKKNLPSGTSPRTVYKTLSGNIRTFLES